MPQRTQPPTSQRTERPPRRVAGHLAARPDATPRLRHELDAFARAHGAGRDLRDRLALCVSEAVTNVVLHAYDGGDDAQVHYAAAVADGVLEVVVADDGHGVRSERRSPGIGMGLRIIAEESDDLRIARRRPHGMRVAMRFVLAARAVD